MPNASSIANPAMNTRLEQIAQQRDEPKAEVVRAALRLYLDEQEDLIGSRKHFTKMFQRRVDYLERLLVIALWLNVQTVQILLERVKREPREIVDLLEDAIHAGVATERTADDRDAFHVDQACHSAIRGGQIGGVIDCAGDVLRTQHDAVQIKW